jgi:hypothetical protein
MVLLMEVPGHKFDYRENLGEELVEHISPAIYIVDISTPSAANNSNGKRLLPVRLSLSPEYTPGQPVWAPDSKHVSRRAYNLVYLSSVVSISRDFVFSNLCPL